MDGYNFVFGLWPESKRDIGAARRRLERRLHQMASRDSLDVTVVWDGIQDANAVPHRRRYHRSHTGGASVVFSPVGYEADDTIVLSCEALPETRPIVVVTWDRELQQRVRRAGANTIQPSALLDLMPRPPVGDARTLQMLASHRASLQEMLLQIDPTTALARAVSDGTMQEIVPEVLALRDVPDVGCWHRDTLDHTIAVVEHAPGDFTVRLAALLQDIGKPATHKTRDSKATFRFHEGVGARMAARRLEALQFNWGIVHDVSDLVAMSNRLDGCADWSDSAIRRYVSDTGPLRAQLNQLICTDRDARGDHTAFSPQEIDDLERRIQQIHAADAVAAERPQINGNDVMAHLGIGPGPQVGNALRWLTDLRRLEGDLPRDELLERLDRWWERIAIR
ncbi:MAG: NYN domain-containing protein [Acidimicrobiaceae bacterium]|nr:NYN domain-containing protein [Acidimicrobiaceae bacterium]